MVRGGMEISLPHNPRDVFNKDRLDIIQAIVQSSRFVEVSSVIVALIFYQGAKADRWDIVRVIIQSPSFKRFFSKESRLPFNPTPREILEKILSFAQSASQEDIVEAINQMLLNL